MEASLETSIKPKNGFKTIYKTDYNSQAALFNINFPEEIAKMGAYMQMLHLEIDEGIYLAYAWLKSYTPPFEKYFKEYDLIIKKLNDCKIKIDNWKKNYRTQRPDSVIDLIDEIYQNWWRAYNDSGAGIKGSVYVPFDTRIKNAVRNL